MARLKRPAGNEAEAVAPKRRSAADSGESSGEDSDASDAPPTRGRSTRGAARDAAVKIAQGFRGTGQPITRAAAAVVPRRAAAAAAPAANRRAPSVAPRAARTAAAAAVAPPRAVPAPTANRRSESVAPPPAARAARAAGGPAAVAPLRVAVPARQPNAPPAQHRARAQPMPSRSQIVHAAAAAVAAAPAAAPVNRQPVAAAPAAAAARQAAAERAKEQASFDTKVDAFFNELIVMTQQQRPTTVEAARPRVEAVTAMIARVSSEFSTAAAHIDKMTMQVVLDEARREKSKLEDEVKGIEEAEAEEARQRQIEELRRAEAARRESLTRQEREEEDKAKAEEEERARKEEEERAEREEREEKHRMEASMLDKECRICLDGLDDPVACVMCENTIGCKECVDEWLQKNRSCIFCRFDYTNVGAQIKRLGKDLEDAIKRKKARETRAAEAAAKPNVTVRRRSTRHSSVVPLN